jgi:diguanylate cyclase (GGDEF)-like protein/PAS domain S-box-containing protein
MGEWVKKRGSTATDSGQLRVGEGCDLQREYTQAVDLLHRLRVNVGNQATGEQVRHLSIPFGSISGDFFCTAEHASEGWFAFLADTTGHGLPAAIFSLRAPDIFRNAVARGQPLEEIYHELNCFLAEQGVTQYFVCGFLLRVRGRELEVLNAGMPPGLLVAADGSQVRRFDSLNLPVGITPDAAAQTESYRLMRGQQATLLLYSDGLAELGQGGDLALPETVMGGLAAEDPAGLLKQVERIVAERGAEVHDDISLLQINLPMADPGVSERKPARQRGGEAALPGCDPLLAGHILAGVNFGVTVTDARHRIVYVNDAFSRITGYASGEALGQTPAFLRSGRHSHQFYQALWDDLGKHGAWSGEIWNRRKDGSLYLEWLEILRLGGGREGSPRYVGLMRDITERQLENKRVRHSALHDSLTGLANRTLLHDRCEQEIRRASRQNGRFALMFIDLDRFKPVNDALGHEVGDHVLKVVTQRLSGVLRGNDTLARYGGDEFVALLPDIEDRGAAAAVAGKVLRALREPVKVAGHGLYVGASIGIASYPDEGRDLDALLARADAAMYRAKEAGGNLYSFYAAEMDQAIGHELHLETRLHSAIAKGELEVHYQPKVNLVGGRVVGFEALVRWRDPQRGLIPPGEFIPLAERSFLISEIGSFVLGEACQALARIRANCDSDLHVAVNVSPRQFARQDLVAEVDAALAAAGLPHSALQLELTEAVFIKNVEQVSETLRRLAGKGVSLALDDFGSGYASLAYLRDLPFDVLKIDREFVRDVHNNRYNGAIARAAMNLAHGMDMNVVAEGIEDGEQHRYLAGIGCHFGQGYEFGRPMPEAELLSHLILGREANRSGRRVH